MKTVTLTPHIFNQLLICAFRYALSRTNGLGHEYAGYIIEHWDDIYPDFQRQIVDEITDSFSMRQLDEKAQDEWRAILRHVKNLEKKTPKDSRMSTIDLLLARMLDSPCVLPDDYPQWVCTECALAAGGRPPELACYHIEACQVCGEVKAVTEPRDFGYPKDLTCKKGFENDTNRD